MRVFKKQINFTIVSSAVLTASPICTGVDSVALGQTSITDGNVPTGSIIKGFLISFGIANPSTTNLEVGVNIQFLLSGQATTVNPLAVGGIPQRNQVMHSWHFTVAQDSMVNRLKFVKIPKQFQRIKEGMIWNIAIDANTSREQAIQVIYKVRL